MSGRVALAETIHKTRELMMESIVTFSEYMRDDGKDGQQQRGHTWNEFLKYAKRRDRGGMASENVTGKEARIEASDREPYPTLYPGEVVGEAEASEEPGRYPRKNMRPLTDRARTNEHRQERKDEKHTEKRIRLAKREDGTRIVSGKSENKIEGGEWETLPRKEDTAARRLLGGHDGGGTYRVFKDDTLGPAHEEDYAGHPILKLFTRTEEMENDLYMSMAKEGIRHMNGTGGKKLTLETLQVAMSLNERHAFHPAVATDGAKKGETKDRTETQRLSETTYGVWQGPESMEILKGKNKVATALQKRIGLQLNLTDKTRAVEHGVMSGRLGDPATTAEAEEYSLYSEVQAQQILGRYANKKARVLIMSDCLSGLKITERVWRERKNIYRSNCKTERC
eukprot:6214132-Pleurochrysis_carterae.AAC.5